MKMKSFYLAVAAALVLTACKKQETVTTLDNSMAPTLSASVAPNGQIPLDFYVASDNAVTFNWTNPNYQFSTGTSTQGVSYRIEVDTLGANFTNPRKASVNVVGSQSKTFTQAEFNDLLYTRLKLKDSMQHSIEVRVVSYLGFNGAEMPSKSIVYKVRPYDIPPKVTPPTTGELYITGSASPAGWMCGNPSACNTPADQKFTRVSPTLYELTVHLNGGQSYLLVPKYNDWGDKYGWNGGNNLNNQNGDELSRGGGDIKAPDATGDYKISVDFKLGTFKVTHI